MVCFFSWIDSFLQNDLNMAKGMIRNRENNLMEILHARVQNLEWLPYSICCSLSGCWPSREAFASQDAALGVYLSRHFVPSRGAVWSLKPRTISMADFVEDIKKCSSKWIKTLNPYYAQFAWQGGYGVFSVSASAVERVKNYVMTQKEHHQKMDFRKEYEEWLKAYGVEYNPEYVFKD